MLVVTDEELLNITLYFNDLDVSNRRKLTNNQMLEFSYFRYSPWKPLLFRGLMLKEDKEFDEITNDDTSIQAVSGIKETSAIMKEQKRHDLNLSQNKSAYIGLKEFAKYLSVFNRKTPLDLKIKCKSLC